MPPRPLDQYWPRPLCETATHRPPPEAIAFQVELVSAAEVVQVMPSVLVATFELPDATARNSPSAKATLFHCPEGIVRDVQVTPFELVATVLLPTATQVLLP